MNKVLVFLLATVGLLSGCVVYDAPRRDAGMHRGERDYERGRGRDHESERGRGRDSDRDGVPDRYDRRPYDRDRY